MKIFKLLAAATFAAFMTACSAVETGEVGVRTSFSGKVKMEELDQGFYTHILSDLDVYTVKETTVELMDMQPKAKDNLTLDDLDIEVYYTIDPSKVADMKVKYSGRDHKGDGLGGVWYPAYDLVRSIARASVYTTISGYDSLTIHQQRETIKEEIRAGTQKVLDKTDPGIFKITKVVIREVKTDPSIENSIKIAVARNKELEAKTTELEIAQKQVEINEVVTNSLTPEILEQMKLEVIREACSKGTCILSLDQGSGATPVLNVRR